MYHVCPVCGFKYEDKYGKAPFDELPDSWRCPICSERKERFTREYRQKKQ